MLWASKQPKFQHENWHGSPYLYMHWASQQPNHQQEIGTFVHISTCFGLANSQHLTVTQVFKANI